jgi:hypothetical protein
MTIPLLSQIRRLPSLTISLPRSVSTNLWQFGLTTAWELRNFPKTGISSFSRPGCPSRARQPLYHILWVRGFRGHTISGRGFNLLKPLRRHFPATPDLPSSFTRHDPGDRNASVQKIDNRLGDLRRDGLGNWPTSAGSNFPLERRAKASRRRSLSIAARRLSAELCSLPAFSEVADFFCGSNAHVFPQTALAVLYQALAIDPNQRGSASFPASRGGRGASRARPGGP